MEERKEVREIERACIREREKGGRERKRERVCVREGRERCRHTDRWK